MTKVADDVVGRFVAALFAHRGRLTHAMDEAGIDYKTAKRLLKKAAVRQAMEEIEQRILDDGEAALLESIRLGGPKAQAWAVPLLLRTKGKVRGYTERMEVESAGPGDFAIKPVDVSDWRSL